MTDSTDNRIQAFISYSQDASPTAVQQAWEFAQKLRHNGIDAHIDKDREVTPPAEGWPAWMLNEIKRADFVLVVSTESYWKKSERMAGSGGLGVAWEGAIITQTLYFNHGQNSKFIPVILAPEDREFIIEPLKSSTHYNVGNDEGLHDLLRRLTKQPFFVPDPVGTVPTFPTYDTAKSDDDVQGDVKPPNSDELLTSDPTAEDSVRSGELLVRAAFFL